MTTCILEKESQILHQEKTTRNKPAFMKNETCNITLGWTFKIPLAPK